MVYKVDPPSSWTFLDTLLGVLGAHYYKVSLIFLLTLFFLFTTIFIYEGSFLYSGDLFIYSYDMLSCWECPLFYCIILSPICSVSEPIFSLTCNLVLFVLILDLVYSLSDFMSALSCIFYGLILITCLYIFCYGFSLSMASSLIYSSDFF
jgi:hypothetical protein